MFRVDKKRASVSVSLVIEPARNAVQCYFEVIKSVGLKQFFDHFDILNRFDLSGEFRGWFPLIDKLSVAANNYQAMQKLHRTLGNQVFNEGDIITVPYEYIAAINLSDVFDHIQKVSYVLSDAISSLDTSLSKDLSILGIKHYPENYAGMWVFDELMLTGITFILFAGVVNSVMSWGSESEQNNRFSYYVVSFALAVLKAIVDIIALSSMKSWKDKLVNANNLLFAEVDWNKISDLNHNHLPCLKPINTRDVFSFFSRGRHLAIEPAKPDDPSEILRRMRSPVRPGY